MKTLIKLLLLGAMVLSTPFATAKDNTLLAITDNNYLSTLLKSDKPVLVKFWADMVQTL
ncbi:MAG: hypothetical protein Q9M36_06870 [Sulfurovum sp.]|nr:hypothetical protein [Sulfurovum sp.]